MQVKIMSVMRRLVIGFVAALFLLTVEPIAVARVQSEVQAATTSMSYATAARFLEQATWGPNATDIATLRQIGFAPWFTQQRTVAESTFPIAPTTANNSFAQATFIYNAMNGPDQLRQRMAFAVGQIFVVSGVKLQVDAMEPYLQTLQDNAFANYRQVMQAVTLSPSMGRYLDMANNDKPNPKKGTLPNENYARELLQLFTIGTVKLNLDGTAQLDSNGSPIPTYDQTQIQNLARVFTGWTYPTQPGATPLPHNTQYFVGQMIPVESNHDMDSKVVFGTTLPGGQTAETDLAQTLDIVFKHPNLPPFVSLRLIQHFVTSNPSPAYVKRISNIFINNGLGVRGDLFAVIKAILLDPEARQGDNNIATQVLTGGHLREPVLYAIGIMRALRVTVAASNSVAGAIAPMGQLLLFPPSVFNYYSPFYRIKGGALAGPEFQLLTPSTAVVRANFVNGLLNLHAGGGVTVDLTPYINIAGNTVQLLNAVNQTLMRGQMPSTMGSTIAKAVNASTDPATRAKSALYLAATSGLYQVEH